jgi:hypothetical protein
MPFEPTRLNSQVQEDTPDFSLVLGGPLYQLFRRARLTDDTLELVRRRIIAAVVITWLPLLIFSALQGLAWSGRSLPFLMDVDSQVRFLIALPLLLYAELIVHVRMRRIVAQFIERGLVPAAQLDRFHAIIGSAMRLRNSIVLELLMIAVVYGVGVNYLWRSVMSVQVQSWFLPLEAGGTRPLAGLWFMYVSLPIFQFLLLRWVFRLVIWARLLWQASRLELRLIPTHPDLCGGLGFLANTVFAFIPLLMAFGALASGSVANWILFEGGTLPQYKLEILAMVAIALVCVLGPLLVFAGPMAAARRKGLAEYGTLAQRYVQEFDAKWLRGAAPEGEAFIGSADIQSLADLNNSFDVVRSMRMVPFTKETIFKLSVITLLPFLPLTLTMFSLEELVDRILKLVF